jgi:chemotaxis-related protein WspD
MQVSARAVAPEIATDDCWNRIGVRGDGSCPDLQRYIHCRNCPVYSAAAARFLDRDLLPGQIDDWTRRFAAPATLKSASTQSAFVFRIGANWLALPAGVIDEVAEPRPVHSVPHRSGIVLGLVNVRGALLVCVSLARLLGIEPDAHGERRRLLVLRSSDGRRVVCPVDEAHGGCRHVAQDLTVPPATVAGEVYTRAVLAWGDRTAGYLDERLIAKALERGLA